LNLPEVLKMVSEFLYPSIADSAERATVRRLVEDPYWSSWLFNVVGFPDDAVAHTEVELCDAPGNFETDLDVLLCDPARPDHAIAHQFKFVKVTRRGVETGKPNKLRKYRKAVRQANLTAALGISQVYLNVLVLVDARDLYRKEGFHFHLSSKLRSIIDSTISTAGLADRIGLYEMFSTQTTDGPPFASGLSRGHLRRQARQVEQPSLVTEWVQQTIGNHGDGALIPGCYRDASYWKSLQEGTKV
jgi:hypothetical protein